MGNPLVSIIIPTYDRSGLIGPTLDSVFRQSYENWECLIVDDGSTDDTEIIVKTWTDKDSRFKYYYKQNGGVSSARNYGINNAKGNYIQFLDSDDILHNRKLEFSLNELNDVENCVNAMVICNFKMLGEDLNNLLIPYCILSPNILNFNNVLYNWDIDFSIPIHSGLFHENLFREFRFPEAIKAYEDWLMWIYVFQKGGQVFFIDRPLVVYRLHPSNICKDPIKLSENYLKAILYLPQLLSKDEVLKYYQFLLKRENEKMKELQTSVDNFHRSKTYSIYLKWRNNSIAKFLSRLLKI